MRSFLQRYSRNLLDVLFLAAVFWAARYLFSAGFGLYEDDLTRIPEALSMNLGGVWGHLVFLLTHYYANRPLHEGLIYLFSWLGWHLGGLWGSYWIGYLLTVLNIALFYALLARKHSRLLALLGGLAYALFSADTTQAYLTMALGGQLSNTLLLAAFHVYLFGPRWLSYLLVYPIILFAYETPFLVFLAAPLLDRPQERARFWRTALVHGGILVAMLLSSFLMRYLQGGSVNFELGYRETAALALTHLALGPAVALGTYFLRPVQALVAANPAASAAALVGFAAIALYLGSLRLELVMDLRALVRTRKFSELDGQVRALLQLAAAGFVMLLLAYPLTFTTSVLAITGRTTRAHLAGVSGAALLFACFAYALQAVFAAYHQRRIATLLLAGLLGLLIGFGVLVQQDYVRAWKLEKEFWTALVPLIPDAGPGTAVLVQPEGLVDVRQIDANTWNLSRVLDQIFTFAPGEASVPRVYRLLPGWEQRIVTPDGRFQLNGDTVSAPPDNYQLVNSDQVILITTRDGTLKRVSGPFEVGGKVYPLKPETEAVLPRLQEGSLYPLLLEKGQ